MAINVYNPGQGDMHQIATSAVLSLEIHQQLGQNLLMHALAAALTTDQKDQIVEAVMKVVLEKPDKLSGYDVQNIFKGAQVEVEKTLWAKYGDKLVDVVAEKAIAALHENVGSVYGWNNVGLADVYKSLKAKMEEAVSARIAADPKWLTDRLEASLVDKVLNRCIIEHAENLVKEARAAATRVQAALEQPATPGSTTT